MNAPSKRRKRTTSYSIGLPDESDISQFAAYWSGRKRLIKLLEYVRLRVPVWWRRDGFHTEPYRGIPPKWHVLRARVHSGQEKDWGTLWIAQCGYEYVNDEILGWFRDFRKTAPKKAERCVKCEEALAEIKRAAAQQKEGQDA